MDFDKELKNLVQKGALLKNEGREVEKLLMNNNPDDGVVFGQQSIYQLFKSTNLLEINPFSVLLLFFFLLRQEILFVFYKIFIRLFCQ